MLEVAGSNPTASRTKIVFDPQGIPGVYSPLFLGVFTTELAPKLDQGIAFKIIQSSDQRFESPVSRQLRVGGPKHLKNLMDWWYLLGGAAFCTSKI